MKSSISSFSSPLFAFVTSKMIAYEGKKKPDLQSVTLSQAEEADERGLSKGRPPEEPRPHGRRAWPLL